LVNFTYSISQIKQQQQQQQQNKQRTTHNNIQQRNKQQWVEKGRALKQSGDWSMGGAHNIIMLISSHHHKTI
jgi:hypothetical protein